MREWALARDTMVNYYYCAAGWPCICMCAFATPNHTSSHISFTGFTSDSYASALSVTVPLLALMGALSLTVEIISAFVKYNTSGITTIMLVYCLNY